MFDIRTVCVISSRSSHRVHCDTPMHSTCTPTRLNSCGICTSVVQLVLAVITGLSSATRKPDPLRLVVIVEQYTHAVLRLLALGFLGLPGGIITATTTGFIITIGRCFCLDPRFSRLCFITVALSAQIPPLQACPVEAIVKEPLLPYCCCGNAASPLFRAVTALPFPL